jgi:hypothetical protein
MCVSRPAFFSPSLPSSHFLSLSPSLPISRYLSLVISCTIGSLTFSISKYETFMLLQKNARQEVFPSFPSLLGSPNGPEIKLVRKSNLSKSSSPINALPVHVYIDRINIRLRSCDCSGPVLCYLNLQDALTVLRRYDLLTSNIKRIHCMSHSNERFREKETPAPPWRFP